MARREVIESVVAGVTDASPMPATLSEADAATRRYVEAIARRDQRAIDAVFADLVAQRQAVAKTDADSRLAADIVADVRSYR